MRTACVLTVSPSMLCTGEGCTWFQRGVYLWGEGYLIQGGCTWFGGVPGLGVYLVLGCTWSGGVPGLGGVPGPRGCQVLPPVNRMTNRCKNITLPQTSFAGGNDTWPIRCMAQSTNCQSHQNHKISLRSKVNYRQISLDAYITLN